MSDSDLLFLPVRALAAKLRAKTVTSVALTEASPLAPRVARPEVQRRRHGHA